MQGFMKIDDFIKENKKSLVALFKEISKRFYLSSPRDGVVSLPLEMIQKDGIAPDIAGMLIQRIEKLYGILSLIEFRPPHPFFLRGGSEEYKYQLEQGNKWLIVKVTNINEIEKFIMLLEQGDIVNDKPKIEEKNGTGYLLWFGEKIKIGGVETGKFRLLDCLFHPFGTAKNIDAIFDAIKLEKYQTRTDISDPYLGENKKRKLISSQFKEIQSILSQERKKVSRSKKFREYTLKLNLDARKAWLGVVSSSSKKQR